MLNNFMIYHANLDLKPAIEISKNDGKNRKIFEKNEKSIDRVLENRPDYLKSFNLVIATNLREKFENSFFNFFAALNAIIFLLIKLVP